MCGGWITETCKVNTVDVIDSVFYVIDLVFLSLFLLEIMLKLFGLGSHANARSLSPRRKMTPVPRADLRFHV
jgi:hypothetical protein